MIDRGLNYGRHHIRNFLRASSPYQSVLDIGAGYGDDLAIARAEQPDANLYAIEMYQPSVVRLAEQGITVYKSNIEQEIFPFTDSSLDVILANQILEHTKELFWIFHEISRSLREGGSLIIGVPNLASLHNRLLLLLGYQPTVIQSASAHVRGFTKHDILRMLHAVFPGGYTLQGFGGSNFYPFPPSLARPLSAMAPGMAWGIFLRLEKCRQYDGEFLDFPARARLETNFFVG